MGGAVRWAGEGLSVGLAAVGGRAQWTSGTGPSACPTGARACPCPQTGSPVPGGATAGLGSGLQGGKFSGWGFALPFAVSPAEEVSCHAPRISRQGALDVELAVEATKGAWRVGGEVEEWGLWQAGRGRHELSERMQR